MEIINRKKAYSGSGKQYANNIELKAVLAEAVTKWEESNKRTVIIEDYRDNQCKGRVCAFHKPTSGKGDSILIYDGGKVWEMVNKLAELVGSDFKAVPRGQAKTADGKKAKADNKVSSIQADIAKKKALIAKYTAEVEELEKQLAEAEAEAKKAEETKKAEAVEAVSSGIDEMLKTMTPEQIMELFKAKLG